MARTFRSYRQADVNLWGAVAISAVGLALLSASIGAFIPPNALAGLHGTRLDGGTLNQLRAEVATMQRQTSQMRFDNARLASVINLGDQDVGDIARRVGALESTLPAIIEQLPPGAKIDLSNVTAAIGESTSVTQVEGGSVSVTTTPLNPAPMTTQDQPMPPMPREPAGAAPAPVNMPDLPLVSEDGFGIAMGPVVTLANANDEWTSVRNKIGALLIGLKPILSSDATGGFHLVAGPLPDIAQAESLCTHVNRVGMQCLPVGFNGYAMPQ